MEIGAVTNRADEASADVLRDVAHELRQPLSTIESLAYYLDMVLPHADERLRDHIAHIRRLVEQSNWIVTSGLGLVCRTRDLNPVPLDMDELMTRAASGLSDPERTGIRFELAGDSQVNLDP